MPLYFIERDDGAAERKVCNSRPGRYFTALDCRWHEVEYRARLAMEASGIDVLHTARAAGLPTDIITDHDCEQNYYGFLLLE